MDEWNYWYGPDLFGELGTRYFLKDALGIAAGLHEYARQSDMVFMANYAQTVNVIGCIKTTKTAAAFETTGLVLKLYRRHFGMIPVAAEAAAPLDWPAAWTADRKALTIGIVNPTLKAVEIPLGDRRARSSPARARDGRSPAATRWPTTSRAKNRRSRSRSRRFGGFAEPAIAAAVQRDALVAGCEAAAGSAGTSALEAPLERRDHFGLIGVFVDDPPRPFVAAKGHRFAVRVDLHRHVDALVPLVELLGREHADAVFRPLQPVADLHPLPVRVLLLGRGLVVEVLHNHVKQQFDVVVVHGLVSPFCRERIASTCRLTSIIPFLGLARNGICYLTGTPPGNCASAGLEVAGGINYGCEIARGSQPPA